MNYIAHDQEQLFNQAHLQAQAEQEVPNDQMLATEHEGSDTTALTADVNSEMRWTLERIKKYSSIKSQTKNYQTYPTYNIPHNNHRIINLNINTGGYRPPVMYAQLSMLMSIEMSSAPAVDAGTRKKPQR